MTSERELHLPKFPVGLIVSTESKPANETLSGDHTRRLALPLPKGSLSAPETQLPWPSWARILLTFFFFEGWGVVNVTYSQIE